MAGKAYFFNSNDTMSMKPENDDEYENEDDGFEPDAVRH